MKSILLVLSLAALGWGQTPIAYADAVIPHLPIGCGFTPSIIMVNPTNRPVNYKVNFFQPDGSAKRVSIGNTRSSHHTGIIGQNGTVEIFFPESKDGFPACLGWAEISADEVVAGYVTLRQQTKLLLGSKAQGDEKTPTETVDVITQSAVPFASRFANRFLVPFRMRSSGSSTTAFPVVTGIALVNPSPDQTATITISYRRNTGCLITRERVTLGPHNQKVFTLDPGDRKDFQSDTPSPVLIADSDGVAEISSDKIELAGFSILFEGPNFVSFPGQAPITRPGGDSIESCKQ